MAHSKIPVQGDLGPESYHGADETTQMTDENFILQEAKNDALTLNLEYDDYNLKQINSSGPNKNSFESSDHFITCDTQVYNQSRAKISGTEMNDEEIPFFNEEGGINQESRMDTSQIRLDKSHLTTLNQQWTNVEKSYSHSQEMHVPDNSGCENYFIDELNAASNMYSFLNVDSETTYSGVRPSERKNAFSVDDHIALPGSSQCNVHIPHLMQENESHFTASNHQWIKNENSHLHSPEMHISEYSGSENSLPVDINTRPCSSRSLAQIPQSHLMQENLEKNVPFQKIPMCSICKKEIAKQVNIHEGISSRNYCECMYKCNICGVRYWRVDSHADEQTCNVRNCQQSFQCRTQLEDHYIIHEKHHSTYCRICQRKIAEHAIPFIPYKCCVNFCKYETKIKGHLISHLYSHSLLKLFKCDHCGLRFKLKKNLVVHHCNRDD